MCPAFLSAFVLLHGTVAYLDDHLNEFTFPLEISRKGEKHKLRSDRLVQSAVWAKHAYTSFSCEDLYMSFAYYSFMLCAYCLLTIQSFLSEDKLLWHGTALTYTDQESYSFHFAMWQLFIEQNIAAQILESDWPKYNTMKHCQTRQILSYS